MDTIQDMIAAQRGELAAVLAGCRPAAGTPRRCARAGGYGRSWRISRCRSATRRPGSCVELASSRGKFNEMADRVARRDAASLSPAELAEAVRSNIGHPWKPPGGGFEGALAHDMIHGLDITVPLGLSFAVPEDRLRRVLPASAAEQSVRYFGTELSGIELRATDLDWSPRFRRPADRRRPGPAAGHLRPQAPCRAACTGDPAARFTAQP